MNLEIIAWARVVCAVPVGICATSINTSKTLIFRDCFSLIYLILILIPPYTIIKIIFNFKDSSTDDSRLAHRINKNPRFGERFVGDSK
ncbi:hypothetical protein [uncultured Helicobacter sp.]|uniref:hypothetical protein n=1 Tax=uncultured Helicobacter sp. TaxID=175537 RepID=UPI002634E6C2|nr:hypothetical protein [uncultured Helicobacter sp.]